MSRERMPKRLSVNAWIKILGPALEQSCLILDCKRKGHVHGKQAQLRLLPPRWEDLGRYEK